ncbi:hypothetical protein NDU88_005133 [Pleurodeles waltl]|uniref:Uncharacterized protein n=1 Tax=Pleurodeles waltl TaxID=8319 RepID=A0AAV7X0A3_PLEWA|nr:hypothetical protein NDU88_005133 [Pleurodeles waltl]
MRDGCYCTRCTSALPPALLRAGCNVDVTFPLGLQTSDSASEAEEEVQDSGSEFSVRKESSDDEATLSADEGPVLEEDTDVPMVQ